MTRSLLLPNGSKLLSVTDQAPDQCGIMSDSGRPHDQDSDHEEDEAFVTAAGTDQVDGEELFDLQGNGDPLQPSVLSLLLLNGTPRAW